jgi:hypothetical protein
MLDTQHLYIVTITSSHQDNDSLMVEAHKVTKEKECFKLRLARGKSLLAEIFDNNIEKMCDHLVLREGKLKVKLPEGT